MSGVNIVLIIGRLGKDPETRNTASGVAVCNFTVATSEKRKDGEHTEWHRIVTFGKTAELCQQYLTKGREVCIEGRIQTRQWDDKDGQRRYSTEIVASRATFLGSRGAGGTDVGARSASTQPSDEYTYPAPVDDSDVPF